MKAKEALSHDTNLRVTSSSQGFCRQQIGRGTDTREGALFPGKFQMIKPNSTCEPWYWDAYHELWPDCIDW